MDFDAKILKTEVIKYTVSDAFAGIQVYKNMLENRINLNYKTYVECYPMM